MSGGGVCKVVVVVFTGGLARGAARPSSRARLSLGETVCSAAAAYSLFRGARASFGQSTRKAAAAAAALRADRERGHRPTGGMAVGVDSNSN